MRNVLDARRVPALELAWGILLLVSGLMAYVIYGQAFGTHWTFDDARVLEGLNKVHGFASGFEFAIHDTEVGPFRRPLAMASFLLNHGDWPLHPSGFRHINALIHILNGLLVALVALRVARLVPSLAPRAEGFAVTLAMAWLLHPLLASTSLMIIQRMTLLAGTFSLLAFLVYLHGRQLLEARPARACVWMSGGLVVGTLFGMLAKETAALTPLMIAVLEFTVLAVYAPVQQRLFTYWRAIFFGLPLLALALYGARYLMHAPSAFATRAFSFDERLASEAIILFEYVRQILLPEIKVMGPFQDDTARIHGFGALTLIALAAWAILAVVATVFRRRLPAFSFAVLFFLVGHVLESTIFPLELYFEHRNYLPSLGILGALAGVAWASRHRWPRFLPVIFTMVMASLLWRVTTLWAEPRAAAQSWAEAHPTSTRAVQNLATQYQIRGDYRTASRIIVDNYRLKPRDGGLALMAVAAQCFRNDPAERGEVVSRVMHDAHGFYNTVNASLTLHRVVDMRIMGRCDAFRPEDVIGIARGLLRNPWYQRGGVKRYDLLIVLARALDIAGDREQAISTRLEAFRTLPELDAARGVFSGLREAGRPAEAKAFLAEARRRAPAQAEIFNAWEKELAK